MDTFCLIFKTFGDYLLPIIGIVLAACAIFPTLEEWFKKRESAMKKNRYRRIIFGISLGVFCILLIAASVRVQVAQSIDQSPIYRNQLVLKDHAKKLASDLSKYADDCSKKHQINQDLLMNVFWSERIRDIIERFYMEGIDSDQVSQLIFVKSQDPKVTIDQKIDAVRDASKELNRLANKLPY